MFNTSICVNQAAGGGGGGTGGGGKEGGENATMTFANSAPKYADPPAMAHNAAKPITPLVVTQLSGFPACLPNKYVTVISNPKEIPGSMTP